MFVLLAGFTYARLQVTCLHEVDFGPDIGESAIRDQIFMTNREGLVQRSLTSTTFSQQQHFMDTRDSGDRDSLNLVTMP